MRGAHLSRSGPVQGKVNRMDAALQTLLGSGPLGAVIVVLILWVYRLQKKLDEVQEARVQDAQETAQTVLEVARAIDENTAVLAERRTTTRPPRREDA